MWPHRFDSFVYYSTALGPLSRQKHTMRTWKDNKVKYNYQPVRQTWADWHRLGGGGVNDRVFSQGDMSLLARMWSVNLVTSQEKEVLTQELLGSTGTFSEQTRQRKKIILGLKEKN